ncbi:MAG: phosphate ABC transporter substrate-binding protein PstS [Micrococcus sp.]|nr:phosphate ABC transporter substrate-binding protein PstS [Micrococcus sp.]
MKASRFGRSAALLSVAALALTACGGNGGSGNGETSPAGNGETTTEAGAAQLSGGIQGGGASSQESAMNEWIAMYTEDVQPQVTVDYASVGSGSGRTGFLEGTYDWAGSDAAIAGDQLEKSKDTCGDEGAFNVPTFISPIAVAYNLEGVDTINMDPETIAAVFAGEITSWNDEKIAAHNPDIELPDTAITVVHRGDDSGTTKNFTAFLDETAGDVWTYGETESWPGEVAGESAQQTSGVVSTTQGLNGAITYADAGQIGQLNSVNVGKDGNYVELTPEAAAAMIDKASEADAGAIDIDYNTDEADVYPVVMVAYNIFCHTYEDADQAELLKDWATFLVSADAQEAASEVAGNAPISDSTRERAMEYINEISGS